MSTESTHNTEKTGVPPALNLPAQTGAGAAQLDSETWGQIRADTNTGNIHIGRGVISKESQVYNLIKRIPIMDNTPENTAEGSRGGSRSDSSHSEAINTGGLGPVVRGQPPGLLKDTREGGQVLSQPEPTSEGGKTREGKYANLNLPGCRTIKWNNSGQEGILADKS